MANGSDMNIAEHSVEIAEKMKHAGLRPTRQRIMLGGLLWARQEGHRHVTAEQLHNEAKDMKIQVSLATVYNTLHQFTNVGLLKEIVVDNNRCYFDTNIDEHHHFFNESTGELGDIAADAIQVGAVPAPPHGTSIASVDVMVRVRNAS